MTSNKPAGQARAEGQGISIRKLLIEVISIVIGVLLALGVDQWNENRNHIRDAKEALINIKNELGTNYELLEYLHKNNFAVYNDTSSANSAAAENGGFIPGLQLQDTAWDTFLNTGIANYVEYDLLYAISQVYSIQDIYKSFGMQLIEADMSINVLSAALGQADGAANSAEALRPRFGFLLLIEEQLLESYSNQIEKMGE